jgi:hypothetical protein
MAGAAHIQITRHDPSGTLAARLTPENRARFLEVLERTGNLSAASDAVGVSRNASYTARQTDPAFNTLCQEALDRATDRLEERVRLRAERGTKRGVWYKGERCGEEREYHDNLSMFMLKAHRPETYRQDVATQVNVGLSVETVAKLTDQELEAIVLQHKAIDSNTLDNLSINIEDCTEPKVPAAPKGPKRSRRGRGGLDASSEGDPKDQHKRRSSPRNQKRVRK